MGCRGTSLPNGAYIQNGTRNLELDTLARCSINFDDQKKYVDLAAAMGYEYVLIDNWWDTNIGRERMKDFIDYAHSKNVDVFLWYSSSGYWNDIVQGPTNYMDNPIIRKKEMKWLHNIGVKGIKVDFFGGDKQETMRLYEAILSDADDNGLMVIFHGCTSSGMGAYVS